MLQGQLHCSLSEDKKLRLRRVQWTHGKLQRPELDFHFGLLDSSQWRDIRDQLGLHHNFACYHWGQCIDSVGNSFHFHFFLKLSSAWFHLGPASLWISNPRPKQICMVDFTWASFCHTKSNRYIWYSNANSILLPIWIISSGQSHFG